MISDDLIVEAAFGHGILDPSPVWTDITAKFQTARFGGGRSNLAGRFEARSGSITFLNDGRFDPNNTQSPYWPNVKIGVPIRLRVPIGETTYDLFHGQAEAWPVDYPQGNFTSTVTVPVVDGFKALHLEDLNGLAYPEQPTDARIQAVLDDIGWPAYSLESGVASVAAVTFSGDSPALEHLHEVAFAEVGVLFIDAAGQVRFHNRVHHSGGAASAGTFDGTRYQTIAVDHNDEYFWNAALITREGGEPQTAQNVGTNDSRRVLRRDGQPMVDDSQALSVAEWIVGMFSEQRSRIERLGLRPAAFADPADVLGRDLRDAVRVQLSPAGDPLDQLSVIEGISHDITLDDWVVSWTLGPLSDIEINEYWELGTSQLGTGTRLA